MTDTPKCPVCRRPLTDGFICLGEYHDVAPHQLGEERALDGAGADTTHDTENRT